MLLYQIIWNVHRCSMLSMLLSVIICWWDFSEGIPGMKLLQGMQRDWNYERGRWVLICIVAGSPYYRSLMVWNMGYFQSHLGWVLNSYIINPSLWTMIQHYSLLCTFISHPQVLPANRQHQEPSFLTINQPVAVRHGWVGCGVQQSGLRRPRQIFIVYRWLLAPWHPLVAKQSAGLLL